MNITKKLREASAKGVFALSNHIASTSTKACLIATLEEPKLPPSLLRNDAKNK